MDGADRGMKPPLEVRREFTVGRLEAQVLMQAYELAVPVIGRPIPRAQTLWDLVEGQPREAGPQRIARGA